MKSGRRSVKLVWLIVVTVGALLALPAVKAAQPDIETIEDEWQAFYLQDQKIGYAHMQIVRKSTGGETLYVTTRKEEVSFSRMGTTITVTQTSKVTEDEDGNLISFERELNQGPITQTSQGEVKNGKLLIETGMGPFKQQKTLPVPEGLCPAALDRYTQKKGYEPGTQYTVKFFEPSFADAEQEPRITVKVGPEEAKEVFEVTKWLHRIEMDTNILPGMKTTHWVDNEGNVWAGRVPLAGAMVIKMRRVTREVALQPADAPELMLSVAAEPDKPIPDAYQLDRLVLLVKLRQEDGPSPEFAEGAWQSVEKTDGGTRVTITKADIPPDMSYQLPYEGEEHSELLEPTPWLEVDHPDIKKMAKKAVGAEKDALRAARRIEDYVSTEIAEKTLSMGFATALETARQKAGDCTEHAVLAAALARAAGIPSRVVTGMAYSQHTGNYQNGAFFYHMWTEVFVGEWLPIDAALGSHSATHLALSRSDLNRSADLITASTPIMKALGAIDIQVLSTNGKPAEAND